MLRILPLVISLIIIGFLLATPYDRRLDGIFSRAAFTLFEGDNIKADPTRERTLRAAGIGTPYREYVTKTYLYTFGGAIAGAVLGVYIGAGTLFALEFFDVVATEESVLFTGGAPGAFDLFVFFVLLVSSTLVGGVGATLAYAIRWQIPSVKADTRRRQIDAGMAQMVAFIYALSRGGMPFPDVMRALARNETVFGEAAAEMGTGVRNLDVFNVDLVSAVQDLSRRSPSDQFERFAENMTSVLQSGRQMSDFLEGEYERYREEAEEQQREILDLLSTTAEIYVTVIVAGLLFLITILLVIGLIVGDTLLLIQLIAYLVLPAGNIMFIAYLSDVTQPLRASKSGSEVLETIASDPGADPTVQTNSANRRPFAAENLARLQAYYLFRSLKEIVATPVRSAMIKPERVLYIVVPVAVLVTLYRLPNAIVGGTIELEILDDYIVQATLFILISYGIVYEISQYRLRRLEAAVPDLLERLASLNEAGISIVSSFDRVRRSDIGRLDAEVDRIWRDIQLGANVSEALARFEDRVRTPSVTRVVTLLRNAMHASNDIGPVLRIAADQARSDRRLERQRSQEMMTYLVVIYTAFFVFLVVIVALDAVLIPNLPDPGAINGNGEVPGFIEFEGADAEAYQLVFFHSALLQSLLSGLVGGMMSSGTIKAGIKHSSIMMAITYVLLTIV